MQWLLTAKVLYQIQKEKDLHKDVSASASVIKMSAPREQVFCQCYVPRVKRSLAGGRSSILVNGANE